MSAVPILAPAYAGYADGVRAHLASQGMLQAIGARLVHLEPGACSIELPFGAAVAQQQVGLHVGTFHMGAIAAIADAAAGCAALSLLAEGRTVRTAESTTNLVSPTAPPLAQATVLRAGRTITVCRTKVFSVDGSRRDLCAVLQTTLLVA